MYVVIFFPKALLKYDGTHGTYVRVPTLHRTLKSFQLSLDANQNVRSERAARGGWCMPLIREETGGEC